MSEDELPELSSLVLQPSTKTARPVMMPSNGPTLRRSPRKQKAQCSGLAQNVLNCVPQLVVSSAQRASPHKQASPRRGPPKSSQPTTAKQVLEDVPKLAPIPQRALQRNRFAVVPLVKDSDDDTFGDLLRPLSKLSLRHEIDVLSGSEKENESASMTSRKAEPTSKMSRITQAAKQQTQKSKRTEVIPKRSNPYISKEAHCEDLDESSGTDGESEDTDLSGFIVDDDVEISFQESEGSPSDSENETSRRKARRTKPENHTGRRLVRGRRKQVLDSEDEAEHDRGLNKALDGLNLGRRTLESQKNAERRKTLEIIDLTSSPIQRPDSPVHEHGSGDELETGLDLKDPLSVNDALTLRPSMKTQPQLLPSKNGPLTASPKRPLKIKQAEDRPTTPPATPPRSPTKLKSPTKLLSPSKRDAEACNSPHRQSMGGFWDAEVVNEWHDAFSPKKAPGFSPRKNLFSRFNLHTDSDGLSDLDSSQPTNPSSQDPFDDSSDSLPSPCESPAKSRSPSKVSALKAEQARAREEKKAKQAAKKKFDAEKEQMAVDLLLALDEYVTDSKISIMAASTGGIQVIWSKTLRSTAGRANWKRTVTKPSGSPIKGDPNRRSIEREPGVIVQHFASIELAEKIIDRPERLVNTLAHEFCHLANFMVSNVRDQPHGESFKRWGSKVTSWLRSSAAKKCQRYRPEWRLAEVTTKHSYVVETKYLWVCAGRPAEKQTQTLAMKMLNIEPDDEDGCGAEYGRHSRSIDVEKQRCGRCKGFLVQVRPTPRAPAAPGSPRKNRSPLKKKLEDIQSSVKSLERAMETVDLSD